MDSKKASHKSISQPTLPATTPTTSFSPMDVDDALTLLGKYGRWQLTYFVILSIGMMWPDCWHTFAYMFQAYTPAHHCMIDNRTDISSAIPWDNKTNAYSSCDIYVNDSQGNITTQKCSDYTNDWTYYDTDVNDTIVSDWDLVCDREYMKQITSTVNAFGILLGSAFFTPLIDRFGRRPLFLGGQWVRMAVGIWNCFTTNYYEYCVVRFLLGFLRPCAGVAAFILACELFPAKQRTFAGVIIEDFWGIAICILAGLMYLISNWRILQLVITLFALLSIPLYWFLPESIPWLLSKGRVKEAEQIIQSAARFNRLENFPKNVFLPPESSQNSFSLTKDTSEKDKDKDSDKEGNREKDNYKDKDKKDKYEDKIEKICDVEIQDQELNKKNRNSQEQQNDEKIAQQNKTTQIKINETLIIEGKGYENIGNDKVDGHVHKNTNNRLSVQNAGVQGYNNEGFVEEASAMESKQENDESYWKIPPTEKPVNAKYSVLDILRHGKLRLFLFISCILWFINSAVYYGLTLNTEELSGDRYLNLFISGLVEIPAYTSAYFVIAKFGRRIPAVLFHLMAGVFLIVSAFIPDKTSDGVDLVPLQITLVMLGKFGITATFGIIYLFTPELFPTSVRSQALGIASVFGRAGGMVAPFSASLNNIEPYLTSVVFGAVALFGGFLVLILPETNKRPLPQTIEDIEAWLKPGNLSMGSLSSSSRGSRGSKGSRGSGMDACDKKLNLGDEDLSETKNPEKFDLKNSGLDAEENQNPKLKKSGDFVVKDSEQQNNAKLNVENNSENKNSDDKGKKDEIKRAEEDESRSVTSFKSADPRRPAEENTDRRLSDSYTTDL